MSIPADNGNLSRRRFLHAGVASAAAATVLAACGGSSGSDAGGGAAATTTTTERRATDRDQRALRTATSLELVLVDVYERATASGVLSAPSQATAELFLAHHRAHAASFQNETLKAGGEPVDAPNESVSQAIAGRLAFGSETDALNLAYELEQRAQATYVASAADAGTAALTQLYLSVAGVDGRHLAVLGGLTGAPRVPASGFAPSTGGLAPGDGISTG